MELTLNLVWAAVALAGVVWWLRVDKPQGRSVLTQLAAVALLAAIMFPQISITDDFWARAEPRRGR